MNKYFLGLLLIFSPALVFAQNETFRWSDFDKSCFEYKAVVSNDSRQALKIISSAKDDLFFVNSNNFLFNRQIELDQSQYWGYGLNSLFGSSMDLGSAEKNLIDNNPKTSIVFDDLRVADRTLLIDLKTVVPRHSFDFSIAYLGKYLPEYSISVDGTSFTTVKNIADFDFRYLKIAFQNLGGASGATNYLEVYDITFEKKKEHKYIMAPPSADDISVFANYRCQDIDKLHKLTLWLKSESAKKIFSSDINTKTYRAELTNNPDYNPDFDHDAIGNNDDNCPYISNTDQSDLDADQVGDVCDLDKQNKDFFEGDQDGDGVSDSNDNCRDIYNPKQTDSNADGRGDLCSDDDQDGIIGEKDNCVYVSNPGQADINVNGVGDACEFDKDGDGVFDSLDNCISIPNENQADLDNDDIGNLCDNCISYNPSQFDKNNNGIGDECEAEAANKTANDRDLDGVLDSFDNCKRVSNPDQSDEDKDNVGDVCDNCLSLQNTDQADKNANKIGDLCEDFDGDGIISYLDNCPDVQNADQKDSDNDGQGDLCTDADRDGVAMYKDNCPYNPGQEDVDHDGVGDQCDKKDNRFIESNQGLMIGFIVFITLIFGIFIAMMLKKISDNEKNIAEKDESK